MIRTGIQGEFDRLAYSTPRRDDGDELRRLACAVIETAIRDAQRGQTKAVAWLTHASNDREFWFACAGLKEPPPGWRLPGVRRRLRKTSCSSIAPDTIDAALIADPGRSNRALGRKLGVHFETVRQRRIRLGL